MVTVIMSHGIAVTVVTPHNAVVMVAVVVPHMVLQSQLLCHMFGVAVAVVMLHSVMVAVAVVVPHLVLWLLLCCAWCHGHCS
jgi:hypothetical protein